MLNVGKEIAVLRHMIATKLRARFAEVFREKTRSHHKDLLVNRIAWRLRSQTEGDLLERARVRATELDNGADSRVTPPRRTPASDGQPATVGKLRISADRRLPMPGTVLPRRYKDRTVIVTVLSTGFENDGELSIPLRGGRGPSWHTLER